MKTFWPPCVSPASRTRVAPAAALLLVTASALSAHGQDRSAASAPDTLPDAPSAVLAAAAPAREVAGIDPEVLAGMSFTAPAFFPEISSSAANDDADGQQANSPQSAGQTTDPAQKKKRRFDITEGTGEVDANGKPIDRTKEQPKRILGFIPNYRAVSSGAKAAPPGFRTNFKTATKQAFDVSSFGFLLITSATAYGIDQHPALDTYNGGNAIFWAYLWRGFVDKTDGTYIGSFILPTVLHEDTRYYALGSSYSPKHRALYAASRFFIAKTYSGHDTPNIAGLGGKVATQAISTTYYPSGSQSFGLLTEKFLYSCAREAGFTVLREFSPEIDRYLTRHRHHDVTAPAPAAPQPPAGAPQEQE